MSQRNCAVQVAAVLAAGQPCPPRCAPRRRAPVDSATKWPPTPPAVGGSEQVVRDVDASWSRSIPRTSKARRRSTWRNRRELLAS